jgi:hypothetical protein
MHEMIEGIRSKRAWCAWMSLALALGLGASRAHADPPAPDVTIYSFEDEQVLANTTSPLGEVLQCRVRANRESLVRAREHFVRELLKSIEAL